MKLADKKFHEEAKIDDIEGAKEASEKDVDLQEDSTDKMEVDPKPLEEKNLFSINKDFLIENKEVKD